MHACMQTFVLVAATFHSCAYEVNVNKHGAHVHTDILHNEI